MKLKKLNMYKDSVIFLTGACAYPTLEMIWRGKTHSSMALAGGLSLFLINKICCEKMRCKSVFDKCLAGSGIITSVELVTGIFVNGIMRLQVWDYSDLPLNILGQICLPFSFIWFFISIPAMKLCNSISEINNDSSKFNR